jgi:hypothetical protein
VAGPLGVDLAGLKKRPVGDETFTLRVTVPCHDNTGELVVPVRRVLAGLRAELACPDCPAVYTVALGVKAELVAVRGIVPPEGYGLDVEAGPEP